MSDDHNANNRTSRQRLASVGGRLGDKQLPLADGWTASALVAHLAFWDRLALARLEKFLRDGDPPALASDAYRDYVNAGGKRQWLETRAEAASRQANEAASELDRVIAALPEDKLRALRALGFPLLYDRSGHRDQHLDEIERALG